MSFTSLITEGVGPYQLFHDQFQLEMERDGTLDPCISMLPTALWGPNFHIAYFILVLLGCLLLVL